MRNADGGHFPRYALPPKVGVTPLGYLCLPPGERGLLFYDSEYHGLYFTQWRWILCTADIIKFIAHNQVTLHTAESLYFTADYHCISLLTAELHCSQSSLIVHGRFSLYFIVHSRDSLYSIVLSLYHSDYRYWNFSLSRSRLPSTSLLATGPFHEPQYSSG
jgi:hypothetical protein